MRPDPAQPVPIVLAPNDFEAQVIAQALNAEGVLATVAGGHTQAIFGMALPFNPVNVMVRRDQRMEAIRVLRRIRAEAQGTPVPDDLPIRAIDEQGRCIVCTYDMSGLDTLVCPECGTNLAEEAALFDARPSGTVLRSKAFRFLLLAFVVMLFLAAAIIGLDMLYPGPGSITP
jgi:hypothetical protein